MTRVVALFLLCACSAFGAEWRGSATLDRIVEDALEAGTMPGAVLLVGRGDVILHHEAYGDRSLVPEQLPMRVDTIFDAASLTKVVVTAPALMMLVEQGHVRLNDRVTRYLPDFAGGPITIRQLLTHTSGLRADVDLEPAWNGYETGIEKALRERPTAEPGSRFIYSDINFILLAEIVRVVSGQRIDEFAQENILGPLGMAESTFLPDQNLLDRVAPTERLADGTILHGTVHDPTTRFMGGIAGHAGLFTTAADLGRFARAMLSGGTYGGSRILSPLSVAQMTTRQSPAGLPSRGLGWDIDSPYASPRGDLLPVGSYGHTGYTGCSLWIDPHTKLWIVLMTNRVHPSVNTSVVRLRSRIGSAAAAALEDFDADEARGWVNGQASAEPSDRNKPVRTGLDVLVAEGFERLVGKRVALITNHTGIDRLGRRNVDLFVAAGATKLVRIFTPEHGLAGSLDKETIADGTDSKTGIPVVSLYRPEQRRPNQEMLADLDAVVFDIQDVGARFYTYITTMAYAMEEAARAGIEFYVLDRPNPITGTRVEGPLLDNEYQSFIGYLNVPVRHGMTVGELALWLKNERGLDLKLEVVAMTGWQREMWFDQTGLPWTPTSPNLRTLDQAALYPGVALLEGLKNYSVGRGTATPFEFVGASWIDGEHLAAQLNSLALPGVEFNATERTPTASVFAGKPISGVRITVVNREQAPALHLGLVLASALVELYGSQLRFEQTRKLIGDPQTIEELEMGLEPSSILARWEEEAGRFAARRRGYLLYP